MVIGRGPPCTMKMGTLARRRALGNVEGLWHCESAQGQGRRNDRSPAFPAQMQIAFAQVMNVADERTGRPIRS